MTRPVPRGERSALLLEVAVHRREGTGIGEAVEVVLVVDV